MREEGDAEKVESSFVQGPNQGSPKFTMCCNSAGAKMRSGRNGNRFLNRSRECTALRLDGRRARRGLHDAAAAPPARLARRSRRRRTRTRTATGTRKERKRERERIRTSRTHLLFLLRPRSTARWITCEEQDSGQVPGSGISVEQFHPQGCSQCPGEPKLLFVS